MKRPTVDYRGLRLSNIHTSPFSHLLLLLGWIVYFILFFSTEQLIPVEVCTPIHAPLDDLIPFCEWFLIPYVGWYGLIAFSLLYFLLYDVDSFKKLQTFIMITQAVALVIFIVLPSRQDLRPAEFPRDNLLTQGVAFLYSIDTNTGVCPSLHVAYSLALVSVWLKYKPASPWWRMFVVVAVIFICLSTVFLKQHSVWDIVAAVPLCLFAEIVLYGKGYWYPRLKK